MTEQHDLRFHLGVHRTQRRYRYSKNLEYCRHWLRNQLSKLKSYDLPKPTSSVVVFAHSTLDKKTIAVPPTSTSSSPQKSTTSSPQKPTTSSPQKSTTPSPQKPTTSTSLPDDKKDDEPIFDKRESSDDDNDLGIVFHVSEGLYKEFEDMFASMFRQ